MLAAILTGFVSVTLCAKRHSKDTQLKFATALHCTKMVWTVPDSTKTCIISGLQDMEDMRITSLPWNYDGEPTTGASAEAKSNACLPADGLVLNAALLLLLLDALNLVN